MKPRFFFRAHSGHVIRTQREIDWAWGAVATLVLVVLLGWAHKADERAGADLAALNAAHSNGFDAGRAAGREDALEQLTPTITGAYEAGLRDGLYAAHGKPEGLALAQACRAMPAPMVARAEVRP